MMKMPTERDERDTEKWKIFERGIRRIFREKLVPLDQEGINRLYGRPMPDHEEGSEDANPD